MIMCKILLNKHINLPIWILNGYFKSVTVPGIQWKTYVRYYTKHEDTFDTTWFCIGYIFYIISSYCHLIKKCRLTFIQTMIIDENGKYIHDMLNVINVTL